MKNKSLRKLLVALAVCSMSMYFISCSTIEDTTKEPSQKTVNDVLDVGAMETSAIKKVLESNGVKIADSYDWSNGEDLGETVYVSKDADSYYLKEVSNVKGYEVWPKNFFTSKEDGHSYLVFYTYAAFMKDNEPSEREEDDYRYSISFMFPNDEIFCIKNFPLLVDLIKIHYGDNYDFKSLETFIVEQIEKSDKDFLEDQPAYLDSLRVVGDYEEKVTGGYRSSGYEKELFPTNRKEQRRIRLSIEQIIEYKNGEPKLKSTN